MIFGPASTANPFSDPHLFWCEAPFAVADLHSLTHEVLGFGPVSAQLPDDLHKAVAKRRTEFLAGRLCAAAALRQAGMPEFVGRDGRAPIWPNGVAGSISHSNSRAIAAVSTHYHFVGLDCEALVPHDRAAQLCAAIFTEPEARLRPDAMPYGVFFTLVFSAKETLYKALSPRLDRVPDFLEVTLNKLTPGAVLVDFEGQTHRVQFRLSQKDCVTLLLA